MKESQHRRYFRSDKSYFREFQTPRSPPIVLRSMRKARPPAPFIVMLYKLIDNLDTDDTIHWDKSDASKFEICDQKKLREVTLKKHYTAKWETFRRQLYFYGFKSHEKDRFWSHPKLDSQDKDCINNIRRVKKRKPKFDQFFSQYPMFQRGFPFQMPSNGPMLSSPPNMHFLNPGLAKFMKTPTPPGSDFQFFPMNTTPKMEHVFPMPEAPAPILDLLPAKRMKLND